MIHYTKSNNGYREGCVMEKIECQTCGWVGTANDLIAACSDNEPCCPSCNGASFMDVEDE